MGGDSVQAAPSNCGKSADKPPTKYKAGTSCMQSGGRFKFYIKFEFTRLALLMWNCGSHIYISSHILMKVGIRKGILFSKGTFGVI